MSQNLDLDITLQNTGDEYDPKTSNITRNDSNVTSDWIDKIGVDYPPRATTSSVTTGSTTNTETYSWDLGDYVIINPTATTACTANNTGLGACTGQFVDVSSKTPSTDPNFYKTHGATYTATEYDAHYLVGNYYQWNAATAGTGGSITNANASGSICPKNWKLPSSGDNTTKGAFGYLLTQYGVASSLSGTSSVNSNTYNIAQSPLFFVRGGRISPNNTNKFVGAGQNGYYWSSRAHSSTSLAYNLNFGSSSVNPSVFDNRYFGFSLRCLIPTT